MITYPIQITQENHKKLKQVGLNRNMTLKQMFSEMINDLIEKTEKEGELNADTSM